MFRGDLLFGLGLYLHPAFAYGFTYYHQHEQILLVMVRSNLPVKTVNWRATLPPPEVGELLYLRYDMNDLHLGNHRHHHLHRQIRMHH